VNTTSSAVNGDPSWNFTPSRSLNSQVVSSMGFQDTASPGRKRCFSSGMINRSKMTRAKALLGPRLWKCGSMEDGSDFKPIVSSPAALTVAGTAISAAARAATVSFRSLIVLPLSCGLL